jgi:hypothetical protein
MTLQWTWRALAMTFGVAMMSALYLELSSRAAWQPELERVRPGAEARMSYDAFRESRAALEGPEATYPETPRPRG